MGTFSNILQATKPLAEVVHEAANRKRQADGIAIVNENWAGFLYDTGKHLEETMGNTDVIEDAKGGYTCAMRFPKEHPDFKFHGKPLSEYIFTKYDERTQALLEGISNEDAKQRLAEQTSYYKAHIAKSASDTEQNLVHGKRELIATQSIEKFSKATYYNPALHDANYATTVDGINSLPLSPLEKDKLITTARQHLSYAAGSGTLHTNPSVLLNSNYNPQWKQNLSFEQAVHFGAAARNQINHQQHILQKQARSIHQDHFDSLLHTGTGIAGLDSMMIKAYGNDSVEYLQFKEKESAIQNAFLLNQEILQKPFSETPAILAKAAPQAGEDNYHTKLQTYEILSKNAHKQQEEANKDPAAFVETAYPELFHTGMTPEQRLMVRKAMQDQKGVPSYAQSHLTSDEKNEYLQRFNSDDPNVIKRGVAGILGMGGATNKKLGHDLLKEVITDESAAKKLLPPLLGYAENVETHPELAEKFLLMAPLYKQLFSQVGADASLKTVKGALDKSSDYKQFRMSLLNGQPENTAFVLEKEQQLMDLSRYYEITHHMSSAASIKRALNELIIDKYHTDTHATYNWYGLRRSVTDIAIPKKEVINGKVVDINKTEVMDKLANMRKGFLTGETPFSYKATFKFDVPETPLAPVKTPNLYEVDKHILPKKNIPHELIKDYVMDRGSPTAKARELIENGVWRYSHNKKTFFYSYLDDDGLWEDIMQDEDKAFAVPLDQLVE